MPRVPASKHAPRCPHLIAGLLPAPMARRRRAGRWRRKDGQPQRAPLAAVFRWVDAGAWAARCTWIRAEDEYQRACSWSDSTWKDHKEMSRDLDDSLYERARLAVRIEIGRREARDWAKAEHLHAALLRDRLLMTCRGIAD